MVKLRKDPPFAPKAYWKPGQPQHPAAAYEARQGLRKAATDYGAACLLGQADVIATAFTKLCTAAHVYVAQKGSK